MNMGKTITLAELKPGDIVLFSVPKKSWESWLIAFFTKSKVSHTGMVNKNPGYILQEIPEHATSLAIPASGTRTLYIRRLKSAPDTSKVAEIAQKYVDEELPYPMSNLAFLGLYILASDFMPNNATGKLIECVLKTAAFAVMEFVNKKLHPGTEVPPMVCSQFAAACYDEAALKYGPEYKIHYNDDVSSVKSLLHKIIEQLEGEDKTYSLENEPAPLLGAANGTNDSEFYCEQLAKEIQNQEKTPVLTAERSISDSLIASFYQYGKGLLKLFGDKTDYPDKKEATAEEIKKVLEELLRIQEAFVTPGDLLSNTTNLEDMGILTYTDDERKKYVDPKDL